MDPNLIQSFPTNEWMSLDELPCLHALHFHVVSEGLFAKLITSEVWGQAQVITSSRKKVRSKEIVSVAILVTDGVGQGRSGW